MRCGLNQTGSGRASPPLVVCWGWLNAFEKRGNEIMSLGSVWPGLTWPGAAWPSLAWPGLVSLGLFILGLDWVSHARFGQGKPSLPRQGHARLADPNGTVHSLCQSGVAPES